MPSIKFPAGGTPLEKFFNPNMTGRQHGLTGPGYFEAALLGKFYCPSKCNEASSLNLVDLPAHHDHVQTA